MSKSFVALMLRLTLVMAVVLQACAFHARPCVGEEPRIRDRSRGIPRTIWDSERLVAGDSHRRCQVLIEPTWAEKHAVWISRSSAVTAVVVTSFGADQVVEAHWTELDQRYAAKLSDLCLRFLQLPPPDCARRVIDGTWYHVAHELDSGRYLMRSFESPRQGSLDEAFSRFAESLRDYAVAPRSLRVLYAQRLQSAAETLAEALDHELTD